MKRKTFNLLTICSLFSLVFMSGCNKQEQPVTEDPIETETPVDDGLRKIEVSGLDDVKVGDVIDLDEHVTVIPGKIETNVQKQDLSFNVTIYSDASDIQQYISDDSITTGESHTFSLTRPGILVLKLTSLDAVKYVTLKIGGNELTDKVDNYFKNNEITSYTVNMAFTYDENYQSVVEETPNHIFYKTDSYFYDPDQLMGVAINKTNNEGYYFKLNSVDKPESFFPFMNTEYSAYTVSKSEFESSYPSLNDIFSSDNMMYLHSIEETFGEQYAYCIPYVSDLTTQFNAALNTLGLSYQHTVNDLTFYVDYISPVVNDEGELEFYTISRNSSLGYILEGPYKLDDLNETDIGPVSEFVNGGLPNTLASTDSIVTRLSNITSYTVTSSGRYEDLDGNPFQASDLFLSYCPEFTDMVNKVTENAFQSNHFSLIDESKGIENAIVMNQVSGNALLYDGDSGTYESIGEYGADLENGITVNDWQNSAYLGGSYRPSLLFRDTDWEYVTYLETGDDVYQIGSYNDGLAAGLITILVGGVSSPVLMDQSGPLYFYDDYSYAQLSLGNKTTDDISGDIYFRMLDSNQYFYYHITFKFSDINKTTISLN